MSTDHSDTERAAGTDAPPVDVGASDSGSPPDDAPDAVNPAGADGDPPTESSQDSDTTDTIGSDGNGEASAATEAIDWEARAAEDPRSPGELLEALAARERERDEFVDDLRRARAEFDNFRKRSMREGAAQRAAGHAEVLTRLLDILDDFDRTVDAAVKSSDTSLAKGVELVYSKLIEALRGLGLRRIDETGVPFDPTRHEAVQQVSAEKPVDEPEVADVFRPGYELDGRVLRAAMVVVRQ